MSTTPTPKHMPKSERYLSERAVKAAEETFGAVKIHPTPEPQPLSEPIDPFPHQHGRSGCCQMARMVVERDLLIVDRNRTIDKLQAEKAEADARLAAALADAERRRDTCAGYEEDWRNTKRGYSADHITACAEYHRGGKEAFAVVADEIRTAAISGGKQNG